MLANIDENIFSIKTSMRMTLALLVFYFLIPKPKIFMSGGYIYALSSAITLLYFLFINFGNPKYKKVNYLGFLESEISKKAQEGANYANFKWSDSF